MYQINEIFASIQGEGYWSGQAAVFIRLSGCNLRCAFCDTEFLRSRTMSVNEILKELENYAARHVVITGGEPLMQDLTELTRALKSREYFIQIETNGMYDPGQAVLDWITVSPKNTKLKIRKAHELKLLLETGRQPDERADLVEAAHRFISPVNPGTGRDAGLDSAAVFDPEAAAYCSRYVTEHPEWRLTVQLHKILGLP